MNASTLRIVRYAMLVFVLGFGAFAYYQSTQRVPLSPEEGGADPNLLRWVGLGLCAIVVAGITVMRRIREQADETKRSTLALVGSALAESAAMFGAVIMFLGGDVVVWVIGTVLLVSTFTLLPADPEQA